MPLVGLYHSGAGSAGIAAELQRLGLLDLVIDQDPDGQIASALHHLLHASSHVEQPAPAEPNEFRLFCAENSPGRPYLTGHG